MITALELPINVRDLDEGRAWYRDVLGLTFDEHHRACVTGVVLALFGFPDVRPCSHVVAQFVTDDLERTQAVLRERGADVGEIDPHNRNLIVTDPTGNRLVFYEPK
jgi:catechol 2,3-dioxygenase-like lactoylglutathione lyase family enzyme